MEDEKKKKRNKKKKNKQNNSSKTTENDSVSGATNGHAPLSENQNGSVQNSDSDFDKQQQKHRLHDEAESLVAIGVDEQQWPQKEAVLEDRIKLLQRENASYMQQKELLEETVKQLRDEHTLSVEKQAALEETIQLLRVQNDSSTSRMSVYADEIKQLKSENDLLKQEVAGLESDIAKENAKFQSQRICWLQKEASLEEKIEQLKTEKDSSNAAQNCSKETLARMNIDMTRLQMQVVELEDSRNSVMKENQQLVENNSDLQLQIQNLEAAISSTKNDEELRKSKHEELNSQIEAVCALVDKLVIENAELVEKVNELFIKLDRLGGAPARSGVAYENAEISGTPSPENSMKMPPLNQKLESVEAEPAAVSHPSETESGEIVQIPLNDNEVSDMESQPVENNEEDAVPLTDAPLIGAPFRLISFVAKYVSGADLVKNDPLT